MPGQYNPWGSRMDLAVDKALYSAELSGFLLKKSPFLATRRGSYMVHVCFVLVKSRSPNVQERECFLKCKNTWIHLPQTFLLTLLPEQFF